MISTTTTRLSKVVASALATAICSGATFAQAPAHPPTSPPPASHGMRMGGKGMSGKDGTPRGEAGQQAPGKSQGMGQGMSMEADRDMRIMDGMNPMMRSMISQMMASSSMGPMAGPKVHLSF
jgi:hypothetical protein